jgi:hypothetical protein
LSHRTLPRTRKAFTDSHKLTIREGVEWARTAQSDWDITQWKDLRGIHDFYRALAWRFCVFLHPTKGIGWIKSRYLAMVKFSTSLKKRGSSVFFNLQDLNFRRISGRLMKGDGQRPIKTVQVFSQR